jgi:hypothetical protein
MTGVHYFVVDLAKGGKSFGDIKKLVDDVYGDMALKKTQIYEILKQVKMGKNTDDRTGFTKQKTADLIASVAAAVAEDRRVSMQDLARVHGMSYGTISRILHSQLRLKGEWFLHRDNALMHTAMVIHELLAKKRIKLLSHPPYSPDLTPADYFLFPKLKKEMAGFTMTQEEFQKEWEGVLRKVSREEFAKAFVRCYERCK